MLCVCVWWLDQGAALHEARREGRNWAMSVSRSIFKSLLAAVLAVVCLGGGTILFWVRDGGGGTSPAVRILDCLRLTGGGCGGGGVASGRV